MYADEKYRDVLQCVRVESWGGEKNVFKSTFERTISYALIVEFQRVSVLKKKRKIFEKKYSFVMKYSFISHGCAVGVEALQAESESFSLIK